MTSKLIATIEQKVGALSAELKSIFTAAEPELEALAKQEAAKVLSDLATALPGLLVAEASALTAAGWTTADISGLGTALGAALSKGIAKLTATPTTTTQASTGGTSSTQGQAPSTGSGQGKP